MPVFGVKDKIKSGIYIPPSVAKAHRLETEVPTLTTMTRSELAKGRTPAFEPAKPPVKSSFAAPKDVSFNAWPHSSLTRLLTGDVKPEWIKGLGRMNTEGKPIAGCKDVFVSSLREYQKLGINFNPTKSNDPADMAAKLDLKGPDLQKIKSHGAWLLSIHPGAKLAVPTERKSECNPNYEEGGFTKSGQQEWVTTNVPIEKEERAGQVQIYKMNPDGTTIRYRFFRGDLLPEKEWSARILQASLEPTERKDNG